MAKTKGKKKGKKGKKKAKGKTKKTKKKTRKTKGRGKDSDSKLTKKELEHFKMVLEGRRMIIAGDVNQMEEEALKFSRQMASGDLSNMPIHMADLGSDNFEQEFTLSLIENEEGELRMVEKALSKIDDKSFGICEGCQNPIKKRRLKALPYAKLCMECKQNEENEL